VHVRGQHAEPDPARLVEDGARAVEAHGL
jgi:hypothetical protein